MKKLILTSLLAVFAATGANAAINDNPLYRPDQGRFYSVTSLESSSRPTTTNQKGSSGFALTEAFGYGVTDRLAIGLETSASTSDWFAENSWDTFGIGLNYRVLDGINWKADVFGSYGFGGVWPYGETFLGEENTVYVWTVGAKVGYETSSWAFAGHIAFDYLNSESFNWGDDGVHSLRVGADAFFAMNMQWSLVLGAEYQIDDMADMWDGDNRGTWLGKIGVNYNIDDAKFIGAYIGKEMNHDAVNGGEWNIEDGFAYGVKFGVEF